MADSQPTAALTAPARRLAAVTKSDSTILSPIAHGLYVGGTGDVAVLAEGDTAAVTFVAVPAGTILPVLAKKVMSTGTTATNIVAMS